MAVEVTLKWLTGSVAGKVMDWAALSPELSVVKVRLAALLWVNKAWSRLSV